MAFVMFTVLFRNEKDVQYNSCFCRSLTHHSSILHACTFGYILNLHLQFALTHSNLRLFIFQKNVYHLDSQVCIKFGVVGPILLLIDMRFKNKKKCSSLAPPGDFFTRLNVLSGVSV